VSWAQTKQRAERVRQIPLAAVLPLLGAQPDRHDPAKWHTPSGPLSVTGMKFMNWRQGVGGGGAIDLVLHLTGLNFTAAVIWLCERFPAPEQAAGPRGAPEPVLRLPLAVKDRLGRVREYLSAERALDPALLEPLIAAGTLYADGRGNAVFLMRSPAGERVGAELRGTTLARWRGMAPGSRKELGCFSAGPATATQVVLCESAIDALSCLQLRPGTLCLSTAGAASRPAWLKPLLDEGREVFCGFDADAAGERLAQALLAFYPAIRRLRPSRHDWNDDLRSSSASPFPDAPPTLF